MARVRRSKVLLEDWPKDDRMRWGKAVAAGDFFDDGGPAAHLSERTRRDLRYQYSCFLGFLATRHPQLLERPAPERPDAGIVAKYVEGLRQTCRETSVAAELQMLRHMLIVLCPEGDWSWLMAIIQRIAAKARPAPQAREQLVTSDQLYKLGLELMERASAAGSASAIPSKPQAFEYRDGLLIALLALVPLRRRTVTALQIGKHLVKVGDCWILDIPPEDTKTRQALEYPLSPEFSVCIDDYLSCFRRRIPGAQKHSGLWASNKARSMDSGAIYAAVRKRTKSAFGFPINLHRFRRAGATLWAIQDPVNVRGAKDLLGHSTFTTTDAYYITGQSRLAGRVLAKVIGEPQKKRFK